MKPHYTSAPASVLSLLEPFKRQADFHGQNVTAAGFCRWQEAMYQRGFDVRPEDVPRPAHQALAVHQDPATLQQLRQRLSLELQFEERAMRRAEAMRKWSSEPSEVEKAEAARADREAKEADRATQKQIDDEVARREAERIAKLRQKIEHEMSNTK